jgi:single-strand DNA-binding protein
MCRFSVAVDRGFAKQGEERQADFFEVQAWRNSAEFVSRYFSKGQMIHVEGRLQNNNYEDKNGVKHYSQVIVADSVSFCGDKRQTGASGEQPPKPAPAYAASKPAQQQQPVELEDLGEFEEILSDGEAPF